VAFDRPRVKNVKLAVDLARHTANGWNDEALPDDYRMIQELLHIDHENLLRRIGAPKEHILAARNTEEPADPATSDPG
jgi:hypothetical protein